MARLPHCGRRRLLLWSHYNIPRTMRNVITTGGSDSVDAWHAKVQCACMPCTHLDGMCQHGLHGQLFIDIKEKHMDINFSLVHMVMPSYKISTICSSI